MATRLELPINLSNLKIIPLLKYGIFLPVIDFFSLYNL